MDTTGPYSEQCFLCAPHEPWIWATSDHFFAMAALGPVVEGMSIIATKRHTPSMFDVPTELLDELDDFSRLVIRRLSDSFSSPVHMTEHGRVGLCEMQNGQVDEHCQHAHRLLFPCSVEVPAVLSGSGIDPLRADSFAQAVALGGHLTEYLYYQAPDGVILVGTNEEFTPRQYFRGVFAAALGAPTLRSWRNHPREELVDAAAARLAT